MKPTVRWTVAVSSETDRRVRRILESAGRKGDLSRFVEDAVKSRLLELKMQSLPTQSRPSANDMQSIASGAETAEMARAGERKYGG